jgi:ATP-dependent Clp protease ATP-binding subunit ClpX
LKDLKKEDLVRILKEPKNALTKQYEALLAMDNVALEITPDALESVAQKAIEREIGARGLRAVMEQTMMKVMYVIPSDLSIKKVIINADCINGGMPQIVRDKANPREKIGVKK